jgi:hypothetical protein
VLRSLARIVPAALDVSLRATTLVVAGRRGVEAARKLGWTGELIEATGAEDAAMVHALVEHARVSGAAGSA